MVRLGKPHHHEKKKNNQWKQYLLKQATSRVPGTNRSKYVSVLIANHEQKPDFVPTEKFMQEDRTEKVIKNLSGNEREILQNLHQKEVNNFNHFVATIGEKLNKKFVLEHWTQ